MAKTLVVYLHGAPVGELLQDNHGQMSFKYRDAWLVAPSALPGIEIDHPAARAAAELIGRRCLAALKRFGR